MLRQETSSSALIDATVILVLLVLLITHFQAAKQAYRQRIYVAKSLEDATRAAHLVEANFIQGKMLNKGWRYMPDQSSPEISIGAESGVITISFPAYIDGGNKTLTLIPINTKTSAGISSLESVELGMSAKKVDISWLCLSSSIHSDRPYIYKNIGTLSGKYAPAACRYIPQKY